MALGRFQYVAARTLDEAVRVVRRDKAAVIAGGTDLLGVLKERVHKEYPETLVDLKTIPGLAYFKEGRKATRIGALTTLNSIAQNQRIHELHPALAEAARTVASPQIRNTGTIGGNICQEPRCWYYRAPNDQFHCLRKGGTQCPALLGDNRYHSVFGGVRVASPACTASCPGNVDIAAYLGKMREREFGGAAEIVLENNPMPALTGRVCPHYCESTCNRGKFDEAVSIRCVERYLGDYVLEHAADLMTPSKSVGKTVGIVGAGPAGLAAAYYLRKAGYSVTVFDRMPEAGGMLTYCIPGYRLPKDLVRKQIAAYRAIGIKFKLGVTLGKDGMTLQAMRKKFDAVLLATGTWRQKDLPIDKAELLISGMEFLLSIEQGRPLKPGNRVVVVGGGNVAVDVAVSVRKLGAKDVTMVCLEAREEMPAFAEEIAEAAREGVNILPSWGPHRILETDGKVTGLELVRCTSVFDAEGRFHPSYDPEQKMSVKCDQIILAIGQAAELEYADHTLRTDRGLIAADHASLATSIKGVFAAGDVVYGPASVIQAIASGRKAAGAIENYLAEGKKRQPSAGTSIGKGLRLNERGLQRSPRLAVTQDRTINRDEMQAEIYRCINCCCVAVNASDVSPVLVALGARIKTTRRTIPAENFFAARQFQSTVLERGEIVREIEIPLRESRNEQVYQKFRIRNSIDFPILSLASVLTRENGCLKDVRMVLGAAAPVPLRLRAVEDYLCGKPANEETAAIAGGIAVQEAQPLAKSGFRIQIVRTLVKRAVLGGHAFQKAIACR
jgi:NADPH-dependent glutamate synthase beta subunit-like oxidoreductase